MSNFLADAGKQSAANPLSADTFSRCPLSDLVILFGLRKLPLCEGVER